MKIQQASVLRNSIRIYAGIAFLAVILPATSVSGDQDESSKPSRTSSLNNLLKLTNSASRKIKLEVVAKKAEQDKTGNAADASEGEEGGLKLNPSSDAGKPTPIPESDKTALTAADGTDKPSAKRPADIEDTTNKLRSTESETSKKEGLRETGDTDRHDVPSGGTKEPAASQTDREKQASESPAGRTRVLRDECPGAPTGEDVTQEFREGDIPLEDTEPPYDAPSAKSNAEDSSSRRSAEQLTDAEISLRNRINDCLQYYLDHPENVVRRGPWAIMHSMLPFGVETEVIAGNRRVNAIGWLCYNGLSARQRMFQPTRRGFRPNVGPGVQGHEGQLLAILAQCKVQRDYPIQIGRRKYSIEDLIRYEMATCRERSELTFKLIGFSYYLDQDARWRDNRGRYWNLEKMVREEIAQPINGAACGGTHRLMGLSYAVIRRQMAGLPLTGIWQQSEEYLDQYVEYTMTLQNPDGSFSTEWFKGRGNDPDVERKVQTTGHMLEWLIYILPDEHLKSPRITRSVEFLVRTVGSEPGRDWPIGPRGHVLRALVLYNQRAFGAQPGKMKDFIAQSRNESHYR